MGSDRRVKSVAGKLIGANTAELRELASAFGSSSSVLDSIENQLNSVVARAPWKGPDAADFEMSYHRFYRPKLRTAADALRTVSGQLEAQAAEQDAASDAGAGSATLAGAVKSTGDSDVAIPGPDTDPADVAEWWVKLVKDDPMAAGELVKDHPELFGNLEGIPYDIRSIANEAQLPGMIDAARAAGDDKRAEYLENVQKALETDGSPVRQLISLDDGPPALAAISIGDLDSAKYSSFLVPGMGSNGETTPTDLTDAALSLWMEEHSLATHNGLDGSVAIVAWMAYDAPEMFPQSDEVFHGDRGREGGDKLESALLGYAATRDASGLDSYLSVVGHSYGSTTAANALADLPKGVVDSFTTLGSAGLENSIGGAKDLNTTDGVFAMQGWEFGGIAGFGRTVSGRQDPTDADFGSIVLNTEVQRVDGVDMTNSNRHDLYSGDNPWNHRGYLDHGTSSLNNTALVNLGLGDEAVLAEN